MHIEPSSLQKQYTKQRDLYPIKNILEDKSLTFSEKIISVKKVETDNTSKKISMAGDIVIVDVDLAMAQDSTGPLAIRSLNEMV